MDITLDSFLVRPRQADWTVLVVSVIAFTLCGQYCFVCAFDGVDVQRINIQQC